MPIPVPRIPLLVEKGRMGRNAAIVTQVQPLYDAEYEAKLGW